MLTPNPSDLVLVTPPDIYRRAAVGEFVALVNDQVPRLTFTVDRAIAIAYALAWHEEHSPDRGSIARHVSALAGDVYPDDLTGLLAAGYATLFPALAPAVSDV